MDERRRTIRALHRRLTRLLDALEAEGVTTRAGAGGLLFRGDGIESGPALLLMEDIKSLYQAHPSSVRTMLKARRRPDESN